MKNPEPITVVPGTVEHAVLSAARRCLSGETALANAVVTIRELLTGATGTNPRVHDDRCERRRG